MKLDYTKPETMSNVLMLLAAWTIAYYGGGDIDDLHSQLSVEAIKRLVASIPVDTKQAILDGAAATWLPQLGQGHHLPYNSQN